MAVLPATYELSGEGIEVVYSPVQGGVALSGDLIPEPGDRPAEVASDPALGHVVTATVLESSRDGTRITLHLVVPSVAHTGNGPAVPITAVAVLASSYVDLVGGPPAVRQSYEVRALAGVLYGQSAATA